MKKFLHMLIVSSLFFIIGFGDVSRALASANEIPPEAFIQNEDPLLDSEALLDDLKQTATSFALVEGYAQNAMLQTQTVFNQLKDISYHLDLVQPLETHLEDVNTSAKRWLGDIKPHMQHTTQNIINFTNTFKAFTDLLREAIEDDDETSFLYAIEYLADQAAGYETDSEYLIEELISYRDDMTEIIGTLSSDYATISTYLEQNEDGGFESLRAELSKLELQLASVNQTIAILAGAIPGAVVTLGLTLNFALASNPVLGTIFSIISVGVIAGLAIYLRVELDKADNLRKQITDVRRELRETENEYAVLSHINTEVETTLTFAQEAFIGAEGLKKQWTDVYQKFEGLNELIDDIGWEVIPIVLKGIINSTENAAEDINEYAKHLQLQYEVNIEEIEE